MLKGVGLNALLCLLYPGLWVVGVAALLADYFHRRWFYQQLAENRTADKRAIWFYHTGHLQRWRKLFKDALSSMSSL